MTCLYEATIDDLVMAFMHIANCRPWLGSSGKGHDSTSSKLKVASGSYEVFSKGKRYEQCGLCLGRLGSIWVYEWKLNLPPDSHCDLHQHDNANHCILCPNTHVKRACIEQSLNVANMMQLIWHPCWRLVTPLSNGTLQDCRPALQKKDVGHCRPILGLWPIPKPELENMAHMLQCTKRWRRSSALPTMWSMIFGFVMMTSMVVWMATRRHTCWIGLWFPTCECEDKYQFVQGFHNACAQTTQRYPLMPWEREVNGCTINTFTVYSWFYARLIKNNDKFIHAPSYTTTRSCDTLS